MEQELALEHEKDEALISHPNIQFENPNIYTTSKKLNQLVEYEDFLVEADKNRKENRRAVQETARLIGKSFIQSYFLLDCELFKIARDFYFSLEDMKQLEK